MAFAAALVGAPQGASQAQTTQATDSSPLVIVVDKERVLRESAVAKRLAEMESKSRADLQSKLNALSEEIEREERELTELREDTAKEVFDERVRAFNDKVQQARRTFQRESEAIQREFARARQQASDALTPVLQQMLAEKGAELVIDRRSVLAARPGADLSSEAIERFDAATETLFQDLALDARESGAGGAAQE